MGNRGSRKERKKSDLSQRYAHRQDGFVAVEGKDRRQELVVGAPWRRAVSSSS